MSCNQELCGSCHKKQHDRKEYSGCAVCDHLNDDCCGDRGMYYPNECDMNTINDQIAEEEFESEEQMIEEFLQEYNENCADDNPEPDDDGYCHYDDESDSDFEVF